MSEPVSPWGTTSVVQTSEEAVRRRAWWIGGGVAAVVLLGGLTAWYFLFYAAPKPLPLNITFEAAALAPGTPGTLTITVHNDGLEPAHAAELAVVLPERVTAASLPQETPSSTLSVPVVALGDIPAGGTASVTLTLDTTLDPGSAAQLKTEVTYAVARDLTKRFMANAKTDLVIKESTVSVAVEAPTAVTRAEPFNAAVRYRSNVAEVLHALTLTIALPPGLKLVSSTPELKEGKIALPDLTQGQSGVVNLRLQAAPVGATTLNLRATVGLEDRLLAERAASISVTGDALAVTATANGREATALALGESAAYTFVVRNTSPTALKDVVVKARFNGTLFDFKTFNTQGGTLAASEPVVTWNGIGVPGLRVLDPGASITLVANMSLKQKISPAETLEGIIGVTATSPTVPAGVSASGVIAGATTTVRLAAETYFDATAYFVDPLKQVVNAGTQPPKVGKQTQYLVRWTITTRNAGLKEAVVTANVPPGARFTGKLAGVTPTQLTYNERTGRITWHAGDVAANATVRAGFQLEIIPAENQIGRDVALLGDAHLAAIDAFTNLSVSRDASELSTYLRGDAQKQGSGAVIP